MMYFLATLITVFSVITIATTTPLTSDSEEPDPASFPSLDLPLPLPFPDSSPLSATTGDNEPNLLSGENVVQNLNFLAPFTLGSPIAQLPGANSAETSSTLDPSTIDETAQTPMDRSINVCSVDGSTGQKVQKRQDWCPRASYFLLPRGSPPINSAKRTELQKKNDEQARVDREWVAKNAKLGVPEDQLQDELFPLWDPGLRWCKRQDRSKARPYPVCCLGPPIFGTMSTPEVQKVRRQQSLPFMNVENCLLFLVGRPYCIPGTQRYCCKSFSTSSVDVWGFTALDCVSMLWDTYPNSPLPWWQRWPLRS